MQNKVLLHTSNVNFSYSPDKQFGFPDIQMDRSETLLILGRSGVGKTTFLHLMAGLLKPDSGTIKLEGTSLGELNKRKLDHFRGRHIGLVFQRPHFVRSISVLDNLLLAQKLSLGKIDSAKAMNILDALGIADKKNDLPARLSVGEQQRASIARSILNEPSLILADEPTSALDDENCILVADLLEKTARDTHSGLMIVTHDNRLKQRFEKRLEL